MYVINHGLAPYFKSLLKTSIDRSDIFSFSFDENLNEATQTSEMDLYVRFWNVNENIVNVCYYGSSFLGYGTHQNLLSHFNDITKDLDHNHLYQISMDGPNVNIKFHQEFSAHFKESNFHSLIDIGSCSLHIIHRSFTTGAEKSGWKLQKVLKGAYHILHNTPAQREDYGSLTGSKTYPLAFCSTQ